MATKSSTVTKHLSTLLADSYILYLQTQNYHWNVKGRMFAQLHLLFEEQYKEVTAAIDEIAERIRALEARAPGSFEEFQSLSKLQSKAEDITAMPMIENLLRAHEHVIATAKQVIESADAANDAATTDLATVRVEAHEKHAWMLRSLLQE